MSAHSEAELFATLAVELKEASSEQLTLETACDRALKVLPAADSASLTLRGRHRHFHSRGATHEMASRADELQYELDEGPCVEAADEAEWYRSGDVATDERWPAWGPAAAAVGVGSMLSVRLLVDGRSFGALNFYAATAGEFSDRADVDLALLYATHVAIALSSVHELSGLETAVQSRHLIGMAQGILMERFGLDADRSFELLRRYSNDLNVKLHDLARQVVDTGQMPTLR